MNLNETILTIEWQIEDIMEAMREHGIEPTEERMKEFLNPIRKNVRNLEEASIAAGWDAIYAALEM